MIRLGCAGDYPVVYIEGAVDEPMVDALESALCALDAEPFVIVSLGRCDNLDTVLLERHLRRRNAEPNVVLATGHCGAFSSPS
jgi:Ni,Fe-hydrogenase III small subunit